MQYNQLKSVKHYVLQDEQGLSNPPRSERATQGNTMGLKLNGGVPPIGLNCGGSGADISLTPILRKVFEMTLKVLLYTSHIFF